MAVPLTSDLPGTPTEAGGDIQIRSVTREAASLSAETSFQVADSRNRVTQDVRARRAGSGRRATVIARVVLAEEYARVSARRVRDDQDPGVRSRRRSVDKRRSTSLVNRWTRSAVRSTRSSPSRSLLALLLVLRVARARADLAKRRSLGDFDARYGNNRWIDGDRECYRARGRYVVLVITCDLSPGCRVI